MNTKEYNLTLTGSDVKILRWCLEVATQAVSNQPKEKMDAQDGIGLVAWIAQVDDLILEQALEGGLTPEIEGQLSFWD